MTYSSQEVIITWLIHDIHNKAFEMILQIKIHDYRGSLQDWRSLLHQNNACFINELIYEKKYKILEPYSIKKDMRYSM